MVYNSNNNNYNNNSIIDIFYFAKVLMTLSHKLNDLWIFAKSHHMTNCTHVHNWFAVTAQLGALKIEHDKSLFFGVGNSGPM